ncbi:hypothetical protein I020019A2_06710 [Bifidobacterium pseudocatenulatum]
MTALRNSGVPIVKSKWFRVWHTFKSTTVEAFNDDARRPNERQNEKRAQDVDESKGISEYGNAP